MSHGKEPLNVPNRVLLIAALLIPTVIVVGAEPSIETVCRPLWTAMTDSGDVAFDPLNELLVDVELVNWSQSEALLVPASLAELLTVDLQKDGRSVPISSWVADWQPQGDVAFELPGVDSSTLTSEAETTEVLTAHSLRRARLSLRRSGQAPYAEGVYRIVLTPDPSVLKRASGAVWRGSGGNCQLVVDVRVPRTHEDVEAATELSASRALSEGQLDRARSHFEKLEQLSPGSTASAWGLAMVDFREENFAGAAIRFENLISKQEAPSSVLALHLAACYASMDRESAAASLLLEMGVTSNLPDAIEVIDNIQAARRTSTGQQP